jgi:hypothetical protein
MPSKADLRKSVTRWCIFGGLVIAILMATFYLRNGQLSPQFNKSVDVIPSIMAESATPKIVEPPFSREDQNKSLLPQKDVIDYAIEFHNGKSNIFFDEEKFLTEYYNGNPANIRKITTSLLNTQRLEQLPLGVNYSIEKPQAMISRMAMITLLRGYYEYDIHPEARKAAHDALESIVQSSIPRDLAAHVKRALVGEKYDSLRILARYEKEEALRLFWMLDSTQRHLLEPGIASGLRLAGIPESQIALQLKAKEGLQP